MGVEELGGNVGENGRAARRDATFGHEKKETSQVVAKVFRRGEPSTLGEEVRGKVFKVVGQGSYEEAGSDLAIVVAKTEAGLVRQAGKEAAAAIGITVVAAGVGPGGAARLLGRGRSRAGFHGGTPMG